MDCIWDVMIKLCEPTLLLGSSAAIPVQQTQQPASHRVNGPC